MLSFVAVGAGATDISSSDHLYVSSEALFVICKDPSFSDNVSILSIRLELVLVLLVIYTTCVSFIIW